MLYDVSDDLKRHAWMIQARAAPPHPSIKPMSTAHSSQDWIGAALAAGLLGWSVVMLIYFSTGKNAYAWWRREFWSG